MKTVIEHQKPSREEACREVFRAELGSRRQSYAAKLRPITKLATMSVSTTIAAAGNALPGALASLRALGYSVTQSEDSALCKAENGVVSFVAEDVLLLLGLVKLYEMRGTGWQPTDQEVEAYLAFDTQKGGNQVGG